jgi:hypothetical protein
MARTVRHLFSDRGNEEVVKLQHATGDRGEVEVSTVGVALQRRYDVVLQAAANLGQYARAVDA